jgi:elongation factor P--(R)-beta-lysine ligase
MLSKQDLLHRYAMWNDVESRIRQFFVERGFLEVRTPLLVASPGMEPNLDPMEVGVKLTNPIQNIAAGLITSPEYSMKKLLGAGMEKIFTITPVFRNNESVNTTNLPEFMMLEWYAPGSYEDLMNETEELLHTVLEDDAVWPRLTHEEANVDENGDPHTDATQFFVTHYPAKDASLAKMSDDGKTAQRFEAFSDGLELCNGFVELTDADEQRKRFEAEQDERRKLGKTIFPIDEDLLGAIGNIDQEVYGNALGIDRLVMLKYGVKDIRDVQLSSKSFGIDLDSIGSVQ